MPDISPATALRPSASVSSRARTAWLRGRWAALPLACGFALSALLWRMATDPEAWERWSRWFPFALRPVFHDLWITLQHLHEADRGLDPLSDPTSEFAYPRPVLLLRHLGVQHVPVEWLGFAQGVLLTLAVVFVLRPFTPLRAVATALLFFTPPVLLGLERANLDFPLFALCAVAAWQWARSGRRRALVWPVAAGIAGALLKLYPLFALCGGALAETGRRRVVWLGGIAVVLAYWVINRTELELVLGKLPVSTGAAWGCMVFFARVERLVRSRPELDGLATIDWSFVGLGLYLAAAVAAALVGFRLAPRFAATRLPRVEWTFYWVGALICCGSFLGANLAYRWVFVLLTLPLLLRAGRSPDPVVALWARGSIGVILLCLWAPLVAEGAVFALIQALNWTCILLFVVGGTALRVTAKSPVFAFLLRLWATPPAPAPALLPAGVEGARAASR